MNRKLIILAAGAMALMPGAAMAQSSASITTSAFTKIWQPINIAEQSSLSFGVVFKPASGSNTVTVHEATGVRTSSLGSSGLGGGSPARASYAITGEPNQNISVTVSSLTLSDGLGDSIPVTLASTVPGGLATLDATGLANVGVGGSFTVTGATFTGDYTGDFTVTVAYN